MIVVRRRISCMCDDNVGDYRVGIVSSKENVDRHVNG